MGVIDWGVAFNRTRELLSKVGLKESPNALITNLGIGKQQLVEIAKALAKKVKLLILDEPTASLNEPTATLCWICSWSSRLRASPRS